MEKLWERTKKWTKLNWTQDVNDRTGPRDLYLVRIIKFQTTKVYKLFAEIFTKKEYWLEQVRGTCER